MHAEFLYAQLMRALLLRAQLLALGITVGDRKKKLAARPDLLQFF